MDKEQKRQVSIGLRPHSGAAAHLFIHGPKPEYAGDANDPYTAQYIPARILSLLKPGRDIAVVPGNCPAVREYADFCSTELKYEPAQIHFTSGKSYLLEVDALEELLGPLLDCMGGQHFALVPYAATKTKRELAAALGVPLFGETSEWARAFATKGILHPNAFPERRPAWLPLLSDHVKDIRVPQGFHASSREELLEAFTKLRAGGVGEMILKPATGSTGEGIRRGIRQEQELGGYDFPLGSVVLEETLTIDKDREGREIVPRVQYTRTMVGLPSDQIMHDFSHAGNRYPSVVGHDFVLEFRSEVERILHWMRPRSVGGFDALSVDGRPVIVDPNTARWTGAHPALFFRNAYAPASHFVAVKTHPRVSVREFWKALCAERIALVPGEEMTGVFPLCHLPGMWGMIGSYASSLGEAESMAKKALELA